MYQRYAVVGISSQWGWFTAMWFGARKKSKGIIGEANQNITVNLSSKFKKSYCIQALRSQEGFHYLKPWSVSPEWIDQGFYFLKDSYENCNRLTT